MVNLRSLRINNHALCCFLICTLLSCINEKKYKKEDDPIESSSDLGDESSGSNVVKKQPRYESDSDLKLAKLWARVDEIQEQQDRLKEKVRVLEKGFTLGLIPEEMKNSKKYNEKQVKIEVDSSVEIEPVVSQKLDETKSGSEGPVKKTDIADDNEEYQSMLAAAHDQFRAGRYGRAIVEYNEVGKKFGDSFGEGAHRYWIAKSWFALRELNTAKNGFADFIQENASSPLIPRAKLELARVEWRLGLRDTAVKRLHEVIEKHPYEDAAEMAKMELDQLDKSL